MVSEAIVLQTRSKSLNKEIEKKRFPVKRSRFLNAYILWKRRLICTEFLRQRLNLCDILFV